MEGPSNKEIYEIKKLLERREMLTSCEIEKLPNKGLDEIKEETGIRGG